MTMLHRLANEDPDAATQLMHIMDQYAPEQAEVMTEQYVNQGEFSVPQQEVVEFIQKALVLEYTSWMSYWTYGNIIRSLFRDMLGAMFFEHADQELEHVGKLLLWLTALGIPAAPALQLQPVPLTTSISEMISILHGQEQEALGHYRYGAAEIAGTVEGFRQLMETIIEQEQEHSLELTALVPYQEQR